MGNFGPSGFQLSEFLSQHGCKGPPQPQGIHSALQKHNIPIVTLPTQLQSTFSNGDSWVTLSHSPFLSPAHFTAHAFGDQMKGNQPVSSLEQLKEM